MQFMTIWKIREGCLEAAAKRFLSTGAPHPEGSKILGRWHSADFSCGFTLVETNDPAAAVEMSATWGDLLELNSHLVVGDDVAGAAMAKRYGS